jgi:hypothetical protein
LERSDDGVYVIKLRDEPRDIKTRKTQTKLVHLPITVKWANSERTSEGAEAVVRAGWPLAGRLAGFGSGFLPLVPPSPGARANKFGRLIDHLRVARFHLHAFGNEKEGRQRVR